MEFVGFVEFEEEQEQGIRIKGYASSWFVVRGIEGVRIRD